MEFYNIIYMYINLTVGHQKPLESDILSENKNGKQWMGQNWF